MTNPTLDDLHGPRLEELLHKMVACADAGDWQSVCALQVEIAKESSERNVFLRSLLAAGETSAECADTTLRLMQLFEQANNYTLKKTYDAMLTHLETHRAN